jgi:hypothetical protein
MRSVAGQTLAELGGPASVLSRQKRDHIYLNRLLNELADLGPDQQPALLLRIYRLVFPHAFAEEAVLWPVMRRLLPDGDELTLRVEREHQEINELVTRLELLDARSPDRQSVLERVVELLRTDVREEEDELLPRLQTKLSHTQLRLLGSAWEAVRLLAPTRAHAIVSRRPPGNIFSAVPLSLLDRSRDFADAIAYRGAGAIGPPLRALSLTLCQTSLLVERLPGVKRREDPATNVEQRSKAGLRVALIATALVSAVILLRKARKGRSRGSSLAP